MMTITLIPAHMVKGLDYDAVARDNIALEALRLSMAEEIVAGGLSNGIFDSFADDSGVSVTENVTLDALGYFTLRPHLIDIFPTGTPGRSTSNGSEYEAIYAFDGDPTTRWLAAWASTALPAYLSSTLPAPARVVKYGLQSFPITNKQQQPGTWQFQGYNGASWVTLDSQSNFTGWGEANADGISAEQVFEVAVPAEYSAYRIYVTASQLPEFTSSSLHEFRGYVQSGYEDGTLQSSTFETGQITPKTLRLYFLHKPVDPVTLNTDLMGHGSRDGGVTWAAGVLEVLLVLSSGIHVLAADIDVSSQPTGQSAVYKITTANGKEQQFHGVALTWS